ncbi:MAG TPA: metallophosphoesterase [Desulfobacteraceae bacterium]|nr:metallophosphoesterase [Desulfobacteraceae bacterium]
MTLFLVSYVLIYLLMHLYAFYHAYRSLQFGRKSIAFAVFFSVFMIASPIIVRLAEKQGLETGPAILAYAGFTWMGILLLFTAVAAFYDVCAVGKWLVLRLRKKPAQLTASYRRRRFFVQLVIVLTIYGYGLFEANQIRTVHITIASPKISQRTEKLRIALISDVHLGLIVGENRLEKILARVKEAEPDLLVSAGDLVDGQLNDLDMVGKMLAQIQPPFGKLAITGNHEFYAGLPESLDFTDKAGFLMLRNQIVSVNEIAFVGVDDRTSELYGDRAENTELELLRRQRRNTFTVLLKHRPVVNPESVGLFDIQLSGHTHKGQIFPFNLFTWLTYRFPGGINMLEYGYLYISNGSGTWGPPIRFLAPPEVTIIDLVHGV